MEHILRYKILTLPAFIWGLQVLYVALALGLFAILLAKTHDRASHVSFQVLYVLSMIIVNVLWRIAIKKLKPEWF